MKIKIKYKSLAQYTQSHGMSLKDVSEKTGISTNVLKNTSSRPNVMGKANVYKVITKVVNALNEDQKYAENKLFLDSVDEIGSGFTLGCYDSHSLTE